MVKRLAATQKTQKYAKRRKISGGMSRRGYQTVARTRGAYSQGEMKYQDMEYSNVIVSSPSWTGTMSDPATFNTLSVPTVGAAINQRIGKGIKIHKVKIRGRIVFNPAEAQAGAFASQQVRLAVVLDKQTNSSQMTGAQIFTSGTTTTSAVNAFQNIDSFGRFRVLKDKTYTIEDPNLAGTDTVHDVNGKSRPFKFSINFKKPLDVRFNATNGGTIADIVDNSIHVVCNAINTGFNLAYVSRVCYKE